MPPLEAAENIKVGLTPAQVALCERISGTTPQEGLRRLVEQAATELADEPLRE